MFDTFSKEYACICIYIYIHIFIYLYIFIHLFNYLLFIYGYTRHRMKLPCALNTAMKCRDYTMRMNSKTSDRTPRQRWANGFRFPSVYTHGNHELLRFAAGCVGWHTSCLPRWSACWRTWGKCCCCILLEREISLLAFGCYLSPICGRLVSSNHSNRFTNWFLRWSKFTSW